MSTYVLVSGSLFRPPEQRTSKNGNPFVTATLKAKDGEAVQWWKVVAFSENAQSELLRLGDGDAVTCQGPLKVETYEKDGETKLSLLLSPGTFWRCASRRSRAARTTRPASVALLLIGLSMTQSPIKTAMIDEWHSRCLEEQAWLTRRALYLMKELLSSQRPALG